METENFKHLYNVLNNEIKRIEPMYDRQADYQTNSKSYYDYLAKLKKLFELLSNRIWEYDEELKKRFEEWDKLIEKFPENVEKLLIEWLKDGTLEEIINVSIFENLNKKIETIDKELREELELIEKEIKVEIENNKNDIKNVKEDIQKEINKNRIELEEQINKKIDMNGYYDSEKGDYNITYERDELSHTSYIIVSIPKKDNEGNDINLKVTDKRDLGDYLHKKTTQFAKEKQATLMINASPDSGRNKITNELTYINNGEILRDDTDGASYNFLIGWDKDNNMRSFPPKSNINDIKDSGIINLIPAFMPLIEGGEDITDNTPLDDLGNAKDNHPRTVLAQTYNNETLFFVSNGRLIGEYGMNTSDVVRVLLSKNVKWAHMLDGGGSTTLVNKHQIINRLAGSEGGENGATERPVSNVIYISKNNVNKDTTRLLSSIGDNAITLQKQNRYLEQTRYQKNNYIELEKYFINGWIPQTTSGDNTPRAWIMPNNTLMMRGVMSENKDSDRNNTAFLQLPNEIMPMFDTHHIVPGNKKSHLYKIVVSKSGLLSWSFWDERTFPNIGDFEERDPIYIRLDSIYIPLNYTDDTGNYNRTQGIQKGWNVFGE